MCPAQPIVNQQLQKNRKEISDEVDKFLEEAKHGKVNFFVSLNNKQFSQDPQEAMFNMIKGFMKLQYKVMDSMKITNKKKSTLSHSESTKMQSFLKKLFIKHGEIGVENGVKKFLRTTSEEKIISAFGEKSLVDVHPVNTQKFY
jgi:hypothetical protein